MKHTQQGMGLLLVIIAIAIFAILAGLYFTKGQNQKKSQFERGQEGIEQAKEIQNKSLQQSQQIQEQLELHNDLYIE